METLADYYIGRNVKIIERYNKLVVDMKGNRAITQVGEEFDVSPHTVKRILYSKAYPYAAEAHEIVNNKSKEEL